MIGFLKPAKFVTPLPEGQIDPSYRRYRLQLFLTAYLGYMAYYFVVKYFASGKNLFSQRWFYHGCSWLSWLSFGSYLWRVNLLWEMFRPKQPVIFAMGLFLSALVKLVCQEH